MLVNLPSFILRAFFCLFFLRHHVEVHDNDWWINKFESYGFRYSKSMTEEVKKLATEERKAINDIDPNGKPFNAQHVWLNMQVFINPTVAAMPKHAHLFSEHGCYKERAAGKIVHKECGTLRGGQKETKLPDSFYPLKLTPEQDQEWLRQVKQSISGADAGA